MEKFRPRRQVAYAATIALFAASLAIPAVTSAAPARITFGRDYDGLRLGGSCVFGDAPPNAALHLVWKDPGAGGTIYEDKWLATSDWGSWHHCSPDGDMLVVGTVLKATVGTYTRTLAMPDLSVFVDRVNDEIRGTGPANATLRLGYVYMRCCADYVQWEQVVVDADGWWTFSDRGSFDNYAAEVLWGTPLGDFVMDRDFAPSVAVTLGRSVVRGTNHADRTAYLVLRDGATNARKATATAPTGEWGSFSAVFVNSAGQPVAVQPGDRVVGLSMASDLRFKVRDIRAVADVATDVVSGNCGTGQGDSIEVLRSGRLIGYSFSLATDPSGNFEIWMGDEGGLGYDPANIRHGDRIRVTCATGNGDYLQKGFAVP